MKKKNILYIILLLFIFLILLIVKYFFRNYKETFGLYSDYINSLDPKETIIIVGKGKNLDDFIKNYNLYKNFDKLALNNAILTKKIKFKYHFRQDFTSGALPGRTNYSKHVIDISYKNSIKKNFNTEFKYSLQNNIITVVPKVYHADLKTRLGWNKIPKFIENNKKTKFIDIIFSDKKEFKIEPNKLTIPKYPYHPPSVTTTALIYAVSKNYKNILFAGVTDYNDSNIKKKYIDYFKLFKQYFPNIKIYGLYPLSKDMFEYNINN